MRCALLAMLAGCSLHFNFDNTHYQCGPEGGCPSGQSCVQDVCVAGGQGGDAGGDTGDAMTDAAGPALRCGTLYSMHETFDTVSPIWTSFSDGGPTTALAGGDLVVSMPSGSADVYAGYGSQFMYDFTGSALEVQLDQAGGGVTVVELRGPGNEKIQMYVESGTLLAVVLNTAAAGTKGQIPYDPQIHKWLRMREASGQTYFEWSTDGTAWTELTHIPDAFSPLDVRIELSAGGEVAQPYTAKFGAVNTNAPLAMPCAADSFVEDFAAIAPAYDLWNDSGTTAMLSGGKVVITTDGAVDHYAGVESTHLFDLAGHALYFDVSPAPEASPFITFVQISAPNDTTSELVFQVEGNMLYMQQHLNNQTVSQSSIAYDPVAQRYWRFRADATTAYFDTAPDAMTWTQQASTPAMFDLTHVGVLGGAGEYGATMGRTVSFAGINTP